MAADPGVIDILWMNPVGTGAFDAETLEMIEGVRSVTHRPTVRHLDEGPTDLEYHLYEHQVFQGMLETMQEAEAGGFAAGVIGCFYDGGLRELREALTMPVVGMGEASSLLAATLGHRFSVIVGRRKWIPKMEDNLVLLGLDRRLASFRSVDMSIAQMAADPDEMARRVLRLGRLAVDADGAEVLLFTELVPPALARRAKAELPVPLLDPGQASWKWAEMASDLYVRTGLTHARAPGYEAPPGVRP